MGPIGWAAAGLAAANYRCFLQWCRSPLSMYGRYPRTTFLVGALCMLAVGSAVEALVVGRWFWQVRVMGGRYRPISPD